jgi:hypothetical protein
LETVFIETPASSATSCKRTLAMASPLVPSSPVEFR